jgi:hypothetical protein
MICAVLLCVLLGHDNFQVRQAAEDSLAIMGVLAIPALQVAMESRDAEVASRAARLLDPMVADYAIVPYIDSIPPDFPSAALIIATYRSKAWEAGFMSNQWEEDYPQDREAGRLFVQEEKPSFELLCVMRKRTKCWMVNRRWE